MPEHRHDRLEACAALSELGADGVPEPVRADRRPTARIDQPGGCARRLQRSVEQERDR
jgi:hypothetical protein